ncbi:hypothetical protein FRB90_007210, partial [Tulasnella sp. 427]
DQPPYHTFTDISWGEPGTHVRIHRFLTGKEPNVKPLSGLTAAILLRAAIIGYGGAGVQPDFDFEAPDQPSMQKRIAWAMSNDPKLAEACQKEGIGSKAGTQTEAVTNPSLSSRATVMLRAKSKL